MVLVLCSAGTRREPLHLPSIFISSTAWEEFLLTANTTSYRSRTGRAFTSLLLELSLNKMISCRIHVTDTQPQACSGNYLASKRGKKPKPTPPTCHQHKSAVSRTWCNAALSALTATSASQKFIQHEHFCLS